MDFNKSMINPPEIEFEFWDAFVLLLNSITLAAWIVLGFLVNNFTIFSAMGVYLWLTPLVLYYNEPRNGARILLRLGCLCSFTATILIYLGYANSTF